MSTNTKGKSAVQRQPVASFLRDNAMVTIYVGPQEEPFYVHESLLCQHPFFESAFDGRFKEATEKSMYLEEEETVTFSLFVTWLYGYDFARMPNRPLCYTPDNIDKTTHAMDLCKAVIFADKIQVIEAQHHFEAQFAAKILSSAIGPDVIPATVIKFIYEEVPESSRLRYLVVWDWVHAFLQPGFKKHLEWTAAVRCNETFNLDFGRSLTLHIESHRSNCTHRNRGTGI